MTAKDPMDQKPAGETVPGETAPESFDPHAPVGHPSAETDEELLAAKAAGLTDPRWKPLTEIPVLSDYYNETYLYLLPSGPRNLYVFWEVGEWTRGEMKSRFGEGFLTRNHLILRVYDVTDVVFDGFNANNFFEVDDFLNDKVAYWVAVPPGRSFVAEIGYRALGTTFFEKVARSNTVFSPRDRAETAERYTAWGSVGLPASDVEAPVGERNWRYNQYLYWKRRTHAAPPEKGCWALVLHQHLPFIRHPEYDVSLEEQWFFEAVVSVYTQLLHLMWRLSNDKVDFRLTVSLTPPLLSMMKDPLLRTRAARHIEEMLHLSRRERGERPRQAVARHGVADPRPDPDREGGLRGLLGRPDLRVPRLSGRRKAGDHHLPGLAHDPSALRAPERDGPGTAPDRLPAVRAGLRAVAARHLARGERLHPRPRRDAGRGGAPLVPPERQGRPRGRHAPVLRLVRAGRHAGGTRGLSDRPADPAEDLVARRGLSRPRRTTRSGTATSATRPTGTTSPRTSGRRTSAGTPGSSTTGSPGRRSTSATRPTTFRPGRTKSSTSRRGSSSSSGARRRTTTARRAVAGRDAASRRTTRSCSGTGGRRGRPSSSRSSARCFMTRRRSAP